MRRFILLLALALSTSSASIAQTSPPATLVYDPPADMFFVYAGKEHAGASTPAIAKFQKLSECQTATQHMPTAKISSGVSIPDFWIAVVCIPQR
jgi:hypothetical protein